MEKYKQMTQQLRLTNSDEAVANYIRWVITGDTARDYWVETCKNELLKHLAPVTHDNGYPVRAVAQATILSLHALVKIKKD